MARRVTVGGACPKFVRKNSVRSATVRALLEYTEMMNLSLAVSSGSEEPETAQELPVSRQRLGVAIVDDDENDRLLMSRAVDQSPHLQTVGSYSSGVLALNGIRASATQAVLMDVRMSGMDGTECAQRLKNVRPDMVIVLISGFAQADAAARAREAGADAYLTKPLSLCQFSETLAVCLRRRQSRAPGPARSTQQGRLTEEPAVRQALRQMVIKMEANPHARDDLFQEAWSISG